MSRRIAVIGGGWYGCHIGASLLALGFDVTVIESQADIFQGASGHNQFRLHMGFHYPRHQGTRIQSRDGFMRFIERYDRLTRPIAENIYAVASGESLLDFPTYRLVMTASGIDFTEVEQVSINITNIDGILKTKERILLTEKARQFFKECLGDRLILGRGVDSVSQAGRSASVDGELFDYVVDATWGSLTPVGMDVYYEPTILLNYKMPFDFPAITLVDGPLCSLYPTEEPGVYTLSSVPHTPLGSFSSAHEAISIRNSTGVDVVSAKRALMEGQISRYVPDFLSICEFVSPQFSLKTKLKGGYADRSCYVYQNGSIISVMSGKIDTVFFATERILNIIEKDAYSDVG